MNSRIMIKICGLTNREDAAYAAELGVDALGFIFAEGSKRRVQASVVRSIVTQLPVSRMLVGVFVNPPLDELHAVMDESGLGVVQLHGDESPEFISAVRYPVIKTFRPRAGFDVSDLRRYGVQSYLFDTFSEEARGGTGRTFDWNLIRGAERYGQVILSGGLTPANVGEAIQAVRPYGVDVSSGVESTPGTKDHRRLKQFVEAVRRTEHE